MCDRRIDHAGDVLDMDAVEDLAALHDALGGACLEIDERVAAGAIDSGKPQDVITFAAMLMGIEPPPEQDLESADLSPLARSFYAENKRASNRKLKDVFGIRLTYTTYRVGLEALWEAGEGR